MWVLAVFLCIFIAIGGYVVVNGIQLKRSVEKSIAEGRREREARREAWRQERNKSQEMQEKGRDDLPHSTGCFYRNDDEGFAVDGATGSETAAGIGALASTNCYSSGILKIDWK